MLFERRLIRWFGPLILVGFFTGCAQNNNDPASRITILKEDCAILWYDFRFYYPDAKPLTIVAHVGPTVITAEEVSVAMNRRTLSTHRPQTWQDMTDEIMPPLVIDKVMLLAAEKSHRFESVHYPKRLHETGRDMLSLDMRNSLSAGTKISDEEINTYYKAHQRDFAPVRMIRFDQIILKTPQNAKNARALFMKKTTFGNGSNSGPVAFDQLPPESRQVMAVLRKDAISPIIRTARGYEIFKKEDDYLLPPPTPEKIKETIEVILLNQKLSQWATEYAHANDIRVTIDDKTLQAMVTKP